MLSREERERRKAMKKGISFEEQMALKGLPIPEQKKEEPVSIVDINQMIDGMLTDVANINEELQKVEQKVEHQEQTQTNLMDRLIAEGII